MRFVTPGGLRPLLAGTHSDRTANPFLRPRATRAIFSDLDPERGTLLYMSRRAGGGREKVGGGREEVTGGREEVGAVNGMLPLCTEGG